MTLPQKIRLLADFAGYPAGEYAYYDEKGFPSYLQSYIAGDEPVVVNIHPDIIKATSGQGIRSEVTDGEESVDRQLEKKCICRKGRIENEDGIDEECPKCTPQTEPIESSMNRREIVEEALRRGLEAPGCFDKDVSIDTNPFIRAVAHDVIDVVLEQYGMELKPLSRKLEDNQLLGSSIPVPPPLESKYEEAAEDIYALACRQLDMVEKEDLVIQMIRVMKNYL